MGYILALIALVGLIRLIAWFCFEVGWLWSLATAAAVILLLRWYQWFSRSDVKGQRKMRRAIKVLRTTQETKEARHAAYYLGDVYPHRDGIDPLLEALRRQDGQVCGFVATEVGHLAIHLAKKNLLSDADRDRISDELVKKVEAPEYPGKKEVDGILCWALSVVSPRLAFEWANRTLNDVSRDAHGRACAATILGLSHDQRGTDSLVRAAHDEHDEVRAAAALAMGQFSDDCVVDRLLPLVAGLTHDPSSDVEKAARKSKDRLEGLVNSRVPARDALIADIRRIRFDAARNANQGVGYWGFSKRTTKPAPRERIHRAVVEALRAKYRIAEKDATNAVEDAVSCKNGHSWSGCTCSICGRTRDNEHSWDKCICSICGETRDKDHSFEGGSHFRGGRKPGNTCSRCGRTCAHDNAAEVERDECGCGGSDRTYVCNACRHTWRDSHICT